MEMTTENKNKLQEAIQEGIPAVLNHINNKYNDGYVEIKEYTIFGKPVASGTIILFICCLLGAFITTSILFQGFVSLMRYWDRIEMSEIQNWIFRKDPLNLPLDILLYGLQGINFIFAGVDIGVNFLQNKDNIKGNVQAMPRVKRGRILKLVILWTIMTIAMVIGKATLGTRDANYHEIHIFAGLVEALLLFAAAEKAAEAGNRFRGNKDKEQEQIEMAKAIVNAGKETENLEKKEGTVSN